MRDLPLAEAWRLAVYFDETGAYLHKQRTDTGGGTSSSPDAVVDLNLSDPNDYEEDYSWQQPTSEYE